MVETEDFGHHRRPEGHTDARLIITQLGLQTLSVINLFLPPVSRRSTYPKSTLFDNSILM